MTTGQWLPKWIMSVALLVAMIPHAWAAESFDWTQRWEIYKAFWDDPRPILKAAREAMAHADPQKNPKAWLEIFCAHTLLEDELTVVKTKDFATAWEIAFSQNLYANQVDLLILKAAYVESLPKEEKAQYASQSGKSASQLYEEALAIAKQHHLMLDANRIIRNYVSYLFSSNEQTKGLTLIEQGLAAAVADPSSDPFDKMLMQNKAATSFRFAGLHEKAEGIMQELAVACERLPLRSFCASVYYELSGYYAFYGKVPQLEKALQALNQSVKLAEAVDDRRCLNAVHLQRGRILLVQKKWNEARIHAEKAMRGFRHMSYLNSAADAVVVLAQADRNLGLDEDAIKVLQETLNTLPENYVRQSMSLRQELAAIHEHRKEWQEALTHRTKQLELERKFQSDQTREQISRQTVALGLQIEEERNKILQQENELQARRLRETELERRIRTQIAIAGLTLFLATLLVLTWMIRKSREIRRLHLYIEKQVLQRFLPPQIISEILAGQRRFDEKPHARTVTILFADLVNFTAQAEKLSPEQLSALLHEFFATMTDVIFREGGTIDKFIGDAIMVVFGAPHEVDPRTQAQQAIQCARSMREALGKLNEDWRQRLDVTFGIRIGIHLGLGVVGNYGSEKRSDYTVIGRTVNLASRIESSAAPNQILVSDAIIQYLDAHIYRAVREFQLKGIEKPIMLYEIVAGQPAELPETIPVSSKSA